MVVFQMYKNMVLVKLYGHRDNPYITSAKGLGWWGQKMAIFADVQYCICADIVGGWVRKSPKIC